MAFATDTFAGDGSKVEFDLTFDFIARDHVAVTRIDAADKETTLTVITTGSPTGNEFIWENDQKIKVGTAPASGEKLQVVRNTPDNNQIVQWADGSYIIAADLNTSDLQWLYSIQELYDRLERLDGNTAGEAIKQIIGTLPVEVDSTDKQKPVVSVDTITKAEAEANPTSPAWDNDEKLGTVGAIDYIFKQVVGDGSSFQGTRKLGQIRIDDSGAAPELFYWDANAATPAWVQIKVKGDTGPPGQDAKVDVDPNTVTGLPGSNAEVQNTGTTSDAKFKFTIPRGDTGAPGKDGVSATIDVDSTETGAPGSDADVVNVGTTSAAKFKFTIPRGDVGPQGPPGEGVDYKGPIDPTQPNSEPSNPKNGDFYVSTAAGSSSWTGVPAVLDGTRLVWNEAAGKWDSFNPVTNTDLSWIAAPDKGTIFNSAGVDAIAPLVDDTNAGLMNSAQKADLESALQPGEEGVTKIIAGDNITVSGDGTGDVTIAAAGGSQGLWEIDGGGAVTPIGDKDVEIKGFTNVNQLQSSDYIQIASAVSTTNENGLLSYVYTDKADRAAVVARNNNGGGLNFLGFNSDGSKITFSVSSSGKVSAKNYDIETLPALP